MSGLMKGRKSFPPTVAWLMDLLFVQILSESHMAWGKQRGSGWCWESDLIGVYKDRMWLLFLPTQFIKWSKSFSASMELKIIHLWVEVLDPASGSQRLRVKIHCPFPFTLSMPEYFARNKVCSSGISAVDQFEIGEDNYIILKLRSLFGMWCYLFPSHTILSFLLSSTDKIPAYVSWFAESQSVSYSWVYFPNTTSAWSLISNRGSDTNDLTWYGWDECPVLPVTVLLLFWLLGEKNWIENPKQYSIM